MSEHEGEMLKPPPRPIVGWAVMRVVLRASIIRPRDAYPHVAELLGLPDTPRLRTRTREARRQLVAQGLLHPGPRGLWIISQAGYQCVSLQAAFAEVDAARRQA